MFHGEHQGGQDMDTTTTAGQKAIEEIRTALVALLEVIDGRREQTDDEATTIEEDILDLLDRLVGKYEGSYWYGGHNGWKAALADPTEKPFDPADWV